jgi:ubiquinone biosynthesis monooxygenase Coq7
MSKFKLPGDLSQEQKLQEIIRVNHAGEYGAKRIYQGHIDFTRDSIMKAHLQHMLSQELSHLKYFEEEVIKRKVRPTALFPLWKMAGYALGAITALMGPKATLICTEAIEEVIEEHYQEQINTLPENEQDLKNKIIQFQQEEVEHQLFAKEKRGEASILHTALQRIIAGGCKIAIKLAKKI